MKYKKLAIFIVLLLLTIPICMYISTIVHFTLTSQFTNISDIQFETVINSVFTDGQHLKVYILLQFLFSLFLVLVTFIQKDNMFQSKLGTVTDTIKTPFTVGQGQHGTARWLQPKEFSKVFNKSVLNSDKNILEQNFNSGGLVVGYKKFSLLFQIKENKEKWKKCIKIIKKYH